MTRTNLTKDVWTEIVSNVDSYMFNLVNEPNTASPSLFKLHYGTTEPAVDTDDFITVNLQNKFQQTISFSNTTIANIYVMPLYDGAGYAI